MNFYPIICLVLLMLCGFSCYAQKNQQPEIIEIKVVTEDSFPIQFLEHGEISGPATTFVKQVLKIADISYHIEVLPWARAYRSALSEPNVLIYSLARTTKRADKFKWVGQIMALDYYLYGAVDSAITQHTTLEELKQYRIGTVRDSAVHQYLLDHNFKNLVTVVKGKQNTLLFQKDRIDLFPANKSTFQAICRKKTFNCHGLKPLYKLEISAIKLYMAFSQQTDDALVEKVRSGYNQMINKQNEIPDITIN